MLTLIASDPCLDERVRTENCENEARDDHRGHQYVPRDRESSNDAFKVWHSAQSAIEPSDVPVRLTASAYLVWYVWPKDPDWVNAHQATDERDDAEDDEEEAARLCHVYRHQWVAHNVVVGTARARELGVLLGEHHNQVHGDHRQD